MKSQHRGRRAYAFHGTYGRNRIAWSDPTVAMSWRARSGHPRLAMLVIEIDVDGRPAPAMTSTSNGPAALQRSLPYGPWSQHRTACRNRMAEYDEMATVSASRGCATPRAAHIDRHGDHGIARRATGCGCAG